MCTRFRTVYDLSKLGQLYGGPARMNYEYNPNVAPTETAPIIRTSTSQGKKMEMARFGLVPSWAKDKKIGVTLLNARIETMRTKPAFREAYAKRRCIIPADGYYEWREENGKKQPYLFTRKDAQPMAMAGLWDYAELGGEKMFSFTIITNEPNPLAAAIHDRMPCIVQNEQISEWLDLKQDGEKALIAFPSELMKIRAVNPVMNNPKMKEKDLIDDWPTRDADIE